MSKEDEIRGSIEKTFVVLDDQFEASEELVKDIQNVVEKVTET